MENKITFKYQETVDKSLTKHLRVHNPGQEEKEVKGGHDAEHVDPNFAVRQQRDGVRGRSARNRHKPEKGRGASKRPHCSLNAAHIKSITAVEVI